MEPRPGEVTFDDFQKLDIRVGRIIGVGRNDKARVPAYTLRVDFGDALGMKQSSAQITDAYTTEELIGRLVLAVVNFPPRRVAGFKSEVLVLGVYSNGGNGPVVLVAPDGHEAVRPGDRLG